MEGENNWIAEHRTKVCLTKTNIMFIYLPALSADTGSQKVSLKVSGYAEKNAECFEESPGSTRWDAGTLVASC